jgi:sodium transport system ATP-binding protein
MRDLIRDLRRDGCCVLFSSHIMQEVSALCDRIVVIAQGKVAADGTPNELRTLTGRENLEDAFVTLSGLETEEIS